MCKKVRKYRQELSQSFGHNKQRIENDAVVTAPAVSAGLLQHLIPSLLHLISFASCAGPKGAL